MRCLEEQKCRDKSFGKIETCAKRANAGVCKYPPKQYKSSADCTSDFFKKESKYLKEMWAALKKKLSIKDPKPKSKSSAKKKHGKKDPKPKAKADAKKKKKPTPGPRWEQLH